MEDGRLPAAVVLNDEERAQLLGRRGVRRDFRDWNRYCIRYQCKVEEKFAYRPLAIVQSLREHTLDIPWQTDQWVRKTAGNPDPFGKVLQLLAEFPGVGRKVISIEGPGGGMAGLDAFQHAFVTASTMVDRDALRTVTGEERQLTRFVVPWICLTPGQFVNRSKGSPYYGFYWDLNPWDPFKPGEAQTAGGGVVVPPALYSMTGVYHYLRALAGQPVDTAGITEDYVKGQALPSSPVCAHGGLPGHGTGFRGARGRNLHGPVGSFAARP